MSDRENFDERPLLESQENESHVVGSEQEDEEPVITEDPPSYKTQESYISSASTTQVEDRERSSSSSASSIDKDYPDGLNETPGDASETELAKRLNLTTVNNALPLPDKPPLSPGIEPDMRLQLPPEAFEEKDEAKYVGKTFLGTFIELPLFFMMLAMSFVMITSQHLIMYKVCRINFNETDEVCQNLENNTDLEEKVQTMSTNFGLYKSLIENIPGIFYAFFIGTWSDLHGRRYPMIFSIVGNMFSAAISIIVAAYDDMPASYLFIASAVSALGGGYISLMLGIFSYVADVSTRASRTLCIARADLALGGAMAIGTVVSGIVVDKWGFIPVYAVSAGLSIIAVLHVTFVLEESVAPLPDEPGKRCRILMDLVNVKNVIESMRTCFRWRENNQRVHLCLLILCQCLLLLPFIGESSVLFYYTSHKFDWKQSDLSYYSAAGIVMSIVGLFIIFRFVIKIYKVSDIVCGIIGITGGIVKGALIGFSWASWVMYAAAAFTCFQPISIPMMRAMLSKLVSTDEQGKVFSLIVCFEAIVPLFSSTLYTQVYNATRPQFAGSVFLMSAAINLIPLGCLLFMFMDNKRRSSSKQLLIEESEDCVNSSKA